MNLRTIASTACLVTYVLYAGNALALTVKLSERLTAAPQGLFGIQTTPTDLTDRRTLGGGAGALNSTIEFSSGSFDGNVKLESETTFETNVSEAEAGNVEISSRLVGGDIDWHTRLGAGINVNFNSTIKEVQDFVPLDLLQVAPTDGAFLEITKSDSFVGGAPTSFSGTARDDVYGQGSNTPVPFPTKRVVGETTVDVEQNTRLDVLGIYSLLTLDHVGSDAKYQTVIDYETSFLGEYDLSLGGVWTVSLSDTLFLADTSTNLGYGLSAAAGFQSFLVTNPGSCGQIQTKSDNGFGCTLEEYFSYSTPAVSFFNEDEPFRPTFNNPTEFLKLGFLDNPEFSRGVTRSLGTIRIADDTVTPVPLPASFSFALFSFGAIALVGLSLIHI